MNSVNLIGRITKDVEGSYTTSGIAVAKFTLAVDRFTKNPETGEKETDFIPIVAWRKTAEFATQYLGKGRLIGVSGRLQIRNWVDNQGTRRYMTEVIAENVQGLDKPRNNGNSAEPVADADTAEPGDPFADE